ncbi:MAG: hypothetical protein QNJ68_21975 [Microcoleaceae cyanobacterium MO_207.B10]|nr:hypothetical protein [Microcoleaceae cyanobacterium MO_207.B10]
MFILPFPHFTDALPIFLDNSFLGIGNWWDDFLVGVIPITYSG